MPLLHLAITEPNQPVKIDSELVAQNLTLIKASCSFKHKGNSNTTEGVAVDLPFISPIDYISSDSSRHVVLPFNFGAYGNSGSTSTEEIDCNFRFNTEHIPKTFNVKSYVINTGASQTFTEAEYGNNNGDLHRIDLYFSYETIHRLL